MRLKLLAGAAVALFTLSSAAMAETHIGWYVAADVGAHKASSQRLTITDTTATSTSSSTVTTTSGSSSSVAEDSARVRALSGVESSSDSVFPDHDLHVTSKQGLATFARVGYQFTPHWRVEAELGDRTGKIKRNMATDSSDNSGIISRSHMNMSLDHAERAVRHRARRQGSPVRRSWRRRGRSQNGLCRPLRGTRQRHLSQHRNDVSHPDKKTYGAWQGIAGLTWALTNRLNLDLTYRHLDVGKVNYNITRETTYDYDVVTTTDDCSYSSGVARAAATSRVRSTSGGVRARAASGFGDTRSSVSLSTTTGGPLNQARLASGLA
ncbi:MAG: hypothetical protein WDN06_05930 [Asticcacaulis sp.]